MRSWQAAYRSDIPAAYLDALSPSLRARFWEHILLDLGGVVYVAEEAGSLWGFCSIGSAGTLDPGPHITAEITALYIYPEKWRRGYGRLLCSTTLDWARSERYSEVALWVLKNNRRARQFYEAQGFIADGGHRVEAHDSGVQLAEVRYLRNLA